MAHMEEQDHEFEKLKKTLAEATEETAVPTQMTAEPPAEEAEADASEPSDLQHKPEKEKFVLQLSEEDIDSQQVLPEEDSEAEEPETDEIHKKTMDKQPKKTAKARVSKTIFYTIAVIGLSVLLSALILVTLNDVFAFSKEDREIQVEVERGSTTKEIAQLLKEKGIIEYPLVFRFVSKMSENDGTYQYGLYTLNPSMSYDMLMYSLQQNAPKKDVLSVTITEGMTLRQIGAMLEEKKICKASDFIDVINRTEFGYKFEDKVEIKPLKYYRIEGYVFPDTYEFFIGEEPESVAKKILRNFNEKITPDLYGRMNDLGWSLEKTLTLASLIQAESGQSDQMRKVSSVFWNRLEHPEDYPNLQSDVTIQYVENNIKKYLSTPNQEMYDAYNTYKCKGLPVGPICNPGLEAIRAALYPEDTDYFYFLTGKDGKFYYAKTLKEHNRNKRNYMD